MYTSTQTHSHKIGPSTVFYFPNKNKLGKKTNKQTNKHETPRTHSQGLSHFKKRCCSKGTTTSTKVTKTTIQSIIVEVLVILEVLYFKRISVSIPRKSPVKIALLCKNVLAGQPLAADFFFSLSQTIHFFPLLKAFSTCLQYNNNNTVSS